MNMYSCLAHALFVISVIGAYSGSAARDSVVVELGDFMNVVFTGRWDSRVVYRNI